MSHLDECNELSSRQAQRGEIYFVTGNRTLLTLDRFLYVNTLRDKQGGGSLFKLPRRSLGKSLLFFAAVVFGQRIKKFCIRGHSRRQQLVVLADRGHVLSRAFRFSI